MVLIPLPPFLPQIFIHSPPLPMRFTHHLLLALLCATLALTAGAFPEFTLDPVQNRHWQSEPQPIPAVRQPLQIHVTTTSTGPIAHAILIHWLDRNGKTIGQFMPRPPFHYPVEEAFNQPQLRVQTIQPHLIPPLASQLRLTISTSDFTQRFPNLPPAGKTTFSNLQLKWINRIQAEKPLNWFDDTEPVTFKACELPPNAIGIQGTLTDSQGKTIADIRCDGLRWCWPNPTPGFYTVAFAFVNRDGSRTPVSETFYTQQHHHQNGQPVQYRGATPFTRTVQNFVVTHQTRERLSTNHPLGINIGHDSEHNPYRIPRQRQFEVASLCGLNAFARFHWADWSAIETQQGTYDWTSIDSFLHDAAIAGYTHDRIFINTLGTPRWNSPKPQNTLWHESFRFFAPLNLQPWRDYLRAAAKRYPDILLWELWNEPHLPGGSIFWQDSSPEQFVDLLKAGYEALKEVNPRIAVIHGGIGSRYLPFFDAITRLGVQNYYDYLGTHCVYDHKPFLQVSQKHHAPVRPFIETEWHTTLYNCNAPDLPSEEDICFRMLLQLAQMLSLNVQKIAAFNPFTSDHLPETARHFAKQPGIQQVSGLFRGVPIPEPRLPALAIRIASDLFEGDITPLGARFLGDGSQQFALFASKRGRIAFLWSQQDGSAPFVPAPPLAKAIRHTQLLDWEGRTVTPDQLRHRRVYFLLNPSTDLLQLGSPLADISPLPRAPELDTSATATYAPLDAQPAWFHCQRYVPTSPRDRQSDFSARFAVQASSQGLRLRVIVHDRTHAPDCEGLNLWEADSIQFSLDTVGKGHNADVSEFAVGKDGIIYKVKTPTINGDLPADYSPAGIPLSHSHATITRNDADHTTTYDILVSKGDLYPLVYLENQPLRFALLVNNNDGRGREGYLEWATGIGGIKAAHRFGTLYTQPLPDQTHAHASPWTRFQNGTITATSPIRLQGLTERRKEPAGISCHLTNLTPGARYRLRFQARGNGQLHAMAYASALPRVNFPSRQLAEDRTQAFELTVAVPPTDKQLTLAIFFWDQAGGWFEITDLACQAQDPAINQQE